MNRKPRFGFFARVLTCATAFAAMMIYLASKTFPGLPLVPVLAWATAFILLAGVAITLGFYANYRWHAWCLNRGGADPQWLWMGGEAQRVHVVRRENRQRPVRRRD
ncbi:hypothetical protein RY831_05050 [Noviherbaspirillum sp. CPCC 100848]|uniref:Transmembrane protein n=1 Tax=Noviherbaspirillum album TaxID=3080276 RepID=A0ABU6J4X2_9BURK|nr:hypothetical protein [Noviherbaspirillum sp. CPCC 100848]MEC4718503.1 hypothetical protein [Noviherbaspirillum sp. CPCC 100848]